METYCAFTLQECTNSDPIVPNGSGRRPRGFEPRHPSSGSVGDFFCQLAELEEASLPAFRFLKRDLVALGAPRSSIRAAGRAARDETRHARMMTALGRRHGGTRTWPVVHRRPRATLSEMTIENAVEGCAREAYGALVATWTACQARNPEVRACFARIARDERNHAMLAWKIARRCSRVEAERRP
jgi:hypothetical protein